MQVLYLIIIVVDLMLYFDQYYGFQQQKIRISPRNYSIDPINIKHSTLNFIDLAGSEKIQGGSSRVKESQHINKSLFFLTQIIQQLSQGRNEQLIPYRNSPLTKILKTSLGGNSKSLIVLCLNPCLSQLDQSLNTLRFGQNAKQIVNTFKVNTMKESSLDQQQMIQELHKKNNCLKDKENEYLKKINYLEEEKNKLASKLQYSESRNFLVSDVDLLRNIEQVQIRHNYDEKLNQYAGLLSVPKFQSNNLIDLDDSMYTIQKEVANEKSKNYFKQDFVLKKISKCNTSDAQFNLKKVIQTYKKKKILLTKKILQKTQAENRKLNRIVEFYSDHDFDQIQKLSEKEIQTIQNNLQDFQSKLNMEMIFRKTLYQQGSCSEYMFIKDIISKNLKPQQIGINFFPKTFFEKNENLLEMTEDNVSSSKQSIDKQDFDIPTTLKLLNQVHKLNNKPVIKIEI